MVKTTGEPATLLAKADRGEVSADGKDLIFVTVDVVDENGLTVPTATNTVQFEVDGPGEIVATDNGDPTNMTPFPSHQREAFSGKVLVIVRPVTGEAGEMRVKSRPKGLKSAQVVIKSHQ